MIMAMKRLFKRRMPDNEVRAVAEMQKEIDLYENTVFQMSAMLSNMKVVIPEIDNDHDTLKYVVSMVRRTMKDNEHFRDQVKDLTAQLIAARKEIDDLNRMQTKHAEG